MSSSLSSSLEMLFGKMESFISTKTVVGDPVEIGGVIIVPLVDVAFGVGAGANDNATEEKGKKEGSAGGLGAKITPSAVLVIMNDSVQLVNVKNQESVNKIIDMVPGILSKFNLGSFFNKKNTENVVNPDTVYTNENIDDSDSDSYSDVYGDNYDEDDE